MIPFTLAQLLDAVTMRPAYEANGLVLVLGDFAYLAKVLLIVGVLAIAYALTRTRRYAWVRVPLLGIGTLVGAIGFASNALTYLP